MTEPTLTVIAGPNGAGKSTLTRSLGLVGDLIDPDAIAREINPQQPEAAAGPAGREALLRAEACILAGQSFAQETTMSGNSTARLIGRAKAAGFRIDLRYVGLKSADIHETRVAKRVEEGGHSVPVADIQRRYYRSLAALPGILAKVDRATLYDNSSRDGHRFVASFANGKFTATAPDAPAWAQSAITTYQESQS